ncbi:MAG: PBP1A family penicillin-binding protein [Candidatus Choladocola sp.]|nr:PBP1A family penicillin-binding protein [Candidatus Choladocola sp.]
MNHSNNQNSTHHPLFSRTIPWKRLLISFGITLAILFCIFIGIIWYLVATAPDIDSITVSPTESATYICDQEGNYLRKLTLATSNRDIVALEEIPLSLQNAIIVIEDQRFYEHGGIDIRGILRAFLSGITSGSFSEGASTITQQLIKNNVFTEWTQENSFKDRFSRKIQEQYLALQLEDRMSKEEILENYLNTINLGAGCYGVQSASRRYFGKDVSLLTLSEAAVLAAIPQNPTGYNPITNPTNNKKRREIVLSYMEEQGYITARQKEEAMADDVYTRIQEQNSIYEEESVYSYYEDALIDQVIDVLISEKGYSQDQAYRAVFSGGLRIYSAQDQSIQEICDEEFLNPANYPEGTEYGVDYALSVADANGLVTNYSTESLRSFVRENINPSFDLLCTSQEEAQQYADAFRAYILGEELSVLAERLTLSPQPQSSLVLMDQKTGFVHAIVGGRGEKTASLTLNRATETLRQPGSTFKILTAYAPALDAYGQTLATTYENEPYRYENGMPVSNWDITDYSGTVTVREAITRSINVIAVKCITAISPRVGFEYAKKFGITTLCESYESDGNISSDIVQPLALGGITRGVSNLELCSAYAAIANSGTYHSPKFFTKILDRHGEVLIDNTSEEGSSVISRETAFLLTDAMKDVVSSSSGTAYGAISAAAQPVAGKTGTTSNYKDIWFVGYTPYYTCCVWGGYDNNKDLPSSSTYHSYNKVLWSAVMDRVHSILPASDFAKPDSVKAVTLCKDSHAIAVADGCPHTYVEYFTEGTEPTEACGLHEPAPETEPIIIYPNIFDILESESESNSETDLSQLPDSGLPDNGQPGAGQPDIEKPGTGQPGTGQPGTGQPDNGQPSPGNPPGNQETLPDETETESQSANEWANPQYETNSLDDFLNRLTGGSLTLP